jgi:hypothetical protein
MEFYFFETRQMVGLRIDQYLLAVIINLDIFKSFNWNSQPFDHCLIVEAPDLIGMSDGNIFYLVSKEPFDRHGGCQSIRIGVDDNQDFVLFFKNIPESLQTILGGILVGLSA